MKLNHSDDEQEEDKEDESLIINHMCINNCEYKRNIRNILNYNKLQLKERFCFIK